MRLVKLISHSFATCSCSQIQSRYGHINSTALSVTDPNYTNTYGSCQAESPAVRAGDRRPQLHVQTERHHATAKGQEKSCHPHPKGWEGTRALRGVQDTAANAVKIHIPLSDHARPQCIILLVCHTRRWPHPKPPVFLGSRLTVLQVARCFPLC